MDARDLRQYKILSEIESGKPITQRSLAREAGIALGLTNLLIKRLVKKGYLKTSNAIRGRRLKYILTPKGIAEKARLSLAYLENTIHLYTETRDKIRDSLAKMGAIDPGSALPRRVIFYGAGEVAEIAYVALDRSLFELVGIVDDRKNGQEFFGHKIGSPAVLEQNHGACDCVIVTSFKESRQIAERLATLSIPAEKLFFL